jgi:hypothetical protein
VPGVTATRVSPTASLSDDVVELARLGEGLRLYSRDVQLSRPIDERLEATVQGSVDCFDKAILLAERQSRPAGERAWLYAHRGAAKMMEYWLGLTKGEANGGDDKLFVECATDFAKGRELLAPTPYPWSLQFSAFLYALRGREGAGPDAGSAPIDDFDRAIGFLDLVGEEGSRQVAVKRSIAMLASYNAVGTVDENRKNKNDDDRTRAARLSIEAALDAVELDPDEFLAAYSSAVSHWALYDLSTAPEGLPEDEAKQRAAETERLRRNTEDAIAAADIRARNAISQALAAIVGLTFVRARLAWDDDKRTGNGTPKLDAVVAESIEFQEIFGLVKPDMETRAMFIRDPAWQAILKSEACIRAFGDSGYDKLRKLEHWAATAK